MQLGNDSNSVVVELDPLKDYQVKNFEVLETLTTDEINGRLPGILK